MESPKLVDLKEEIENLAYMKWYNSEYQDTANDHWFWLQAEAEVMSRFNPVRDKEIYFKPTEIINNEVP